jgi:hypothetical protein
MVGGLIRTDYNIYNVISNLWTAINNINTGSASTTGGGTGTSSSGGGSIANIANGVATSILGACTAAGFATIATSIGVIEGQIAVLSTDVGLLNTAVASINVEITTINTRTMFLNQNIFSSNLIVNGGITTTTGNFNTGLNSAGKFNCLGSAYIEGSLINYGTTSTQNIKSLDATINNINVDKLISSSNIKCRGVIDCLGKIFSDKEIVCFNQNTTSLNIYGKSNLQQDVNMGSNCVIENNLYVANDTKTEGSNFCGFNYVANNEVINGTLIVGNVTTPNKQCSVNVYGGLMVRGNAIFNAQLEINGSLIVYGNIILRNGGRIIYRDD